MRVAGRVGPGSARPAIGGLGIVVAAAVIVTLLAWPNLVGEPQATPTPTAPVTAASSEPGPTPTAATGSETPSPSLAPSPTPLATAYVEPTVVDRPGVPPALYEKYWIAGGSIREVGQVGTTARIVMPSNEAILGADAGRVASYAIDPETNAAISGPNGTTIIVRDIRTGAVVRTFDTGIHVSYGLMTGSLLFWIGRTLPLDAPTSTDAGVWVIDVADPQPSPRAIIAPTDLDAAYGQHAGRSVPRLSDRGRTILTTVGGIATSARATQVIDVRTLSLRMTVEGEVAYAIGDGTALVRTTDGVALLNLATGRQVGPQLMTDSVMRSVVGERELFVQHGRFGEGVYITAIALDSGATRDILHQPRGVTTSQLIPELSAPGLLVLFDDEWQVDATGRWTVQVTLLDPATGQLQPDAFTLGAW